MNSWNNWNCWIFIVILCYWIKGSLQGPHEERLIDDIFNNRKYQKLARPVAEEMATVTVKFGLTLNQIIKVDEKNEFLHTNLWLNYEWEDYNLKWNVSEYGGIRSIRLPPSTIWTPDLILYNTADEDVDSKFMTNVIVNHDGSCSWIPLGLFISSCSINIQWFPFDDQYCTLKFGSWTYDSSKINLTIKDIGFDMSSYTESGEWEIIEQPSIINVKHYDCCPELYQDITFILHLRRRTLYYGFNLIIPCALISMLTLLTFILPPDEGEKIGLGITILLSLSVFQLIVADMVPATSMAVPLVGVYFACVMIMCTVSVIMTVIVLNFHHRSPDMYEMPIWVKRLICEWLAWSLKMSRPGKDISRKVLMRRARLRELEARTPPSLSLISNVKDLDNQIPLCGADLNNCRSISMECDDNTRRPMGMGMGMGMSNGCLHSTLTIKSELLAILAELRYMTRKLKEDSDRADETNDWKFAAMVIDRLCFWIFSAYLIIATLIIFISPVIVSRMGAIEYYYAYINKNSSNS